jgi:hypothetical protein
MDLSPIQPQLVSGNCQFRVGDITQDLADFNDSSVDLVHSRCVNSMMERRALIIVDWFTRVSKRMNGPSISTTFSAFSSLNKDGLSVQRPLEVSSSSKTILRFQIACSQRYFFYFIFVESISGANCSSFNMLLGCLKREIHLFRLPKKLNVTLPMLDLLISMSLRRLLILVNGVEVSQSFLTGIF